MSEPTRRHHSEGLPAGFFVQTQTLFFSFHKEKLSLGAPCLGAAGENTRARDPGPATNSQGDLGPFLCTSVLLCKVRQLG